MNTIGLSMVVGVFLATIGNVRADVILGWNVFGVNSPATWTANGGIDADLETGSGWNTLTRVGLGNPGGSTAFVGNGWNITDTFNANDDYFTFSLRATAGDELSMSNLQYVTSASATAPATARWGYSIDGGAFVLQDPFTLTAPSSTGPLNTWDFPDVQTTGTVEFRYWQYGSVAVGGGASDVAGTGQVFNKISSNDLILNGSVNVVPEPGSLALMTLGVVGLQYFRRRHYL